MIDATGHIEYKAPAVVRDGHGHDAVRLLQQGLRLAALWKICIPHQHLKGSQYLRFSAQDRSDVVHRSYIMSSLVRACVWHVANFLMVEVDILVLGACCKAVRAPCTSCIKPWLPRGSLNLRRQLPDLVLSKGRQECAAIPCEDDLIHALPFPDATAVVTQIKHNNPPVLRSRQDALTCSQRDSSIILLNV